MTDHTHLCLVLAAPALEGVGLEVGNGDESAEVTEVNPVGVRGVVQALMEELGSTVSDLTVSLHLPKPEPSITAGRK